MTSLAATGSYLFSGSTDCTLRVWSTRLLVPLGQLNNAHEKAVSALYAIDVPKSGSQGVDNQNSANNSANNSNNSNVTGILFSGSCQMLRIWHVMDDGSGSESGVTDENINTQNMLNPARNHQNPAGSTPIPNDSGVYGVVFDRRLEGFLGFIRGITSFQNQLYVASEQEIRIFSMDYYNPIHTITLQGISSTIPDHNYRFRTQQNSHQGHSRGNQNHNHNQFSSLNRTQNSGNPNSGNPNSGNHQNPNLNSTSQISTNFNKPHVYSLTVTQQYIICGTNQNHIHVYNRQSFEPVGNLSGHVGTVTAFALWQVPNDHPNRFRLFSASDDKSLRVWSMENMVCTQSLIRHTASVTSLAISRGRIFSGSMDNTVKVWQ